MLLGVGGESSTTVTQASCSSTAVVIPQQSLTAVDGGGRAVFELPKRLNSQLTCFFSFIYVILYGVLLYMKTAQQKQKQLYVRTRKICRLLLLIAASPAGENNSWSASCLLLFEIAVL